MVAGMAARDGEGNVGGGEDGRGGGEDGRGTVEAATVAARMVYGRWREGRRRGRWSRRRKRSLGDGGCGTVETGTVVAGTISMRREVSKEEERSRWRREENRDERDEREASVLFSSTLVEVVTGSHDFHCGEVVSGNHDFP
ncbi:hypothetical protein Syun_016317 [Stephania yunnanensis]|uniref:Uncharacterized protein n=1 Tax=Stephania yunnanensis TaxID=152371 RepID=A0AAP0J5Q9_9MAGN